MEDKEYAEKIREGLIKQFIDVMLEAKADSDEYYRIKNYVDGSNGVFRYEIEDGKVYGYGPYQLSTSLLDGWWSLLSDDRITCVYKDIYEKIRYEKELPNVYIDPVTTRERNRFYTDINNYKMLTYISSRELEKKRMRV